MGLFKYFKEYNKEIKQLNVNLQKFRKLDEKLVDALYAPVVRDMGDAHLIDWKNDSFKQDTDTRSFCFRSSIIQVSEYYMDINPVLSAALWGIWNATDYHRYNIDKRHGFLKLTPKPIPKLFEHYHALVATATVQFANGDSNTFASNDAIRQIDDYKARVNEALEHLKKF